MHIPLKDGIYEVSFGHNSKVEVYPTLMSYIPKLDETLIYEIRR